MFLATLTCPPPSSSPYSCFFVLLKHFAARVMNKKNPATVNLMASTIGPTSPAPTWWHRAGALGRRCCTTSTLTFCGATVTRERFRVLHIYSQFFSCFCACVRTRTPFSYNTFDLFMILHRFVFPALQIGAVFVFVFLCSLYRCTLRTGTYEMLCY